MYFRVKKTPSGEVTQLLESYRDVFGRSRNRVVVSLGKMQIPENSRNRITKAVESELRCQSDLIVEEYSTLENTLISRVLRLIEIRGTWCPLDEKRSHEKATAVEEAREEKKKKAEQTESSEDTSGTEVIDGVITDKISHTSGAELGPELAGLSIWNQLKLDTLLLELGFSKLQRSRAASLVINRLVDPVSEHKLPFWLEGTALPELLGDGLLGNGCDRFYRAGDKLLANADRILEHVRTIEKAEFGLDRSILLYDLTNTYFEGTARENPKACRGNSKHKRNDCPQIVVGMVFDRHGFELGHCILEGNRSDSTTLKEMIQTLEKNIQHNDTLPLDSKPLIILDGGIATKGNLKYLRDEKYKYLVNDSRRGRGKYRTQFLSEEKNFSSVSGRDKKPEVLVKLINDPLMETDDKTPETPADKIVLCKSSARREKEVAIRSSMEQRFLEKLEKLNASIKKGTLKDEIKIQRKIGAIQKKYPRAAKFYDVKFFKDAPEVRWSDKEGIKDADDDMLGCYVLRTNFDECSPDILWHLYITLTRAEDGFKAIKGNLGIRPNFHRVEDRVDAHVFISVFAYHLLRYILFKLEQADDTRSWQTIKRILSTHAYTTITLPTINKEIHRIRKPAVPDCRQKEIYKKLGVSWTGLPSTHIVAEASALY